MSEVLGFRHSHEAWHALEVSFSHRSKTRELQLKDELQLMHRGSQSIAEFSRTFKGLCDQLAAIGRPIDDTDKVHWYLLSLGPDYKIFSTTMMSQLPLPSFAEIVPKALSHEIFERSVSHSYSNSANFVQQTSKVAGHKQVKHRSSASPTPFANSKSSSNSSVRCQLCDKEGHLAKRCWNFLKLKKKQSANLAEAFSACSIQDFNDSEWFPDSGATSHMTSDTEGVDQSTVYSGNERVMVGNGQSLAISHTGSISSLVPSSPLLLSNVLVVPGIKKNLISISQLTKDNNCCVTFSSSSFTIQDRVTRVVLGVGRCENGLYMLDRRHHALVSTTSSPRASVRLWHTRLGHPHYRTVASLSKLGSISCSNKLVNNDSEICVGCRLGKSHRLPFSLNNERCAMPFDRLHCDLWGPSPVSSFNGYRYYAVFIDDFFRQNQIISECDGGTEFTNNKFRSHLHSCGIDLVWHVLTLLVKMELPNAFSTAVFLINRLPSPSLAGKTPYELLFGYSTLHKGFRCLDRKTHRVYVSRHVQFYEHTFPYNGDSVQNLPSNIDYIHFSEFQECVSSSSNVTTSDSLPSPSFSNSLCLPCNDIPHLSSTSSPGPQVPLDEDSLLDSVATDSTTPSPVLVLSSCDHFQPSDDY
ncbi:Retrovirus-related Pol polyprotein from transposon RE1 [Vitis vinifera]|uniref:Retrovirus-related Pol polyprotein from transposon RE1 n=1 Tax=Vitis vinifera TaxID=29760 RepID=A0A438GRP4_VITVI|nr:Retrovirus-related Pol polyprotein from transposon RE1 [Vitis vinifera]